MIYHLAVLAAVKYKKYINQNILFKRIAVHSELPGYSKLIVFIIDVSLHFDLFIVKSTFSYITINFCYIPIESMY